MFNLKIPIHSNDGSFEGRQASNILYICRKNVPLAGFGKKKVLPPIVVLVRGMSYSVVIAERSRRCPGNDEIGVIVSVRYDGLVPL